MQCVNLRKVFFCITCLLIKSLFWSLTIAKLLPVILFQIHLDLGFETDSELITYYRPIFFNNLHLISAKLITVLRRWDSELPGLVQTRNAGKVWGTFTNFGQFACEVPFRQWDVLIPAHRFLIIKRSVISWTNLEVSLKTPFTPLS